MSSTVTNPEPLYVVDTHALIWYLLNDKKLSTRAKALFEAAEQHQTMLIISAIVMAELYYANAKTSGLLILRCFILICSVNPFCVLFHWIISMCWTLTAIILYQRCMTVSSPDWHGD